MKKHVYLLIILATFVVLSLFSLSYEEFPLGAYSYIDNNNSYVAQKIQDLGYNSTVIVIRSDNYTSMLQTLHDKNLSAIVIDRASSNSTTPLTTSSYQIFEAEFSDTGNQTLLPNDPNKPVDLYWYKSGNENNKPRVGLPYRETNISPFIWVWLCQKGIDNPGYAYTDLRWRWGDQRRVGEEIRIAKKTSGYEVVDVNNNYLYITYRVKMNNFNNNLQPDDIIFKIQTLGYEETSPDTATVVLHNNCYNALTGWNTYYTYGDYQAAGSPTSYFDITVKISYAELIAKNLLKQYGSDEYTYYLVNLNPRLYWYSISNLYIDTVTFEDEMHKNLVTQTGYPYNPNDRLT